MTNKDFKEGMEVTCELANEKVYNASLKNVGWNNWYIHATRNGLTQDWSIGDGSDLERYGVTNLQPKHRTIDDLECGDYVVDECGWKRKCLGRCGEIYAVSNYWKDDENDSDKIHCEWYSGYQLKKAGWTLYQPTEEKEEEKETDIDRCIKVVEKWCKDVEFWQVDKLLQALKNLKNKYETKNN